MVFSGLTTACRLATCPTIRSPFLGFTATTEGNSRPPSERVITTGSPPSIAATPELVVPRSMPRILPIFLSLQLCRHHDHRRPDDTVLKPVAALQFAYDDTALKFVRLFLHHRFVIIGIERLAHAGDPLDVLALKNGEQLAVDEVDAVHPLVAGKRFGYVVQRPLKIVEDR